MVALFTKFFGSDSAGEHAQKTSKRAPEAKAKKHGSNQKQKDKEANTRSQETPRRRQEGPRRPQEVLCRANSRQLPNSQGFIQNLVAESAGERAGMVRDGGAWRDVRTK